MQAAPFQQRQLLDLQNADGRLTALAYRKAQALSKINNQDLTGTYDQARSRAGSLEAANSDNDRDLQIAIRELDKIAGRSKAERGRLADGSVTGREAVRVQKELEALAVRTGDLIVKRDKLQAQQERFTQQLATVKNVLADIKIKLTQVREDSDAVIKEFDADIKQTGGMRAALAGKINTELLGLYEKIRERSVVGATELNGHRCMGCRLEKSPAEMKRINQAGFDDIVRCEECDAILVRTEKGSNQAAQATQRELDEFTN